MRCSSCGGHNDKVVDSRETRDGASIRRRRECLSCGNRFTTYEEIEHEKLRLKKRNGEYEEFERHKLLAGIEKACEKRPVSTQQVEALTDKITAQLMSEENREVTSEHIGELVMQHLRGLDEVAYVRFASVYRQFCDADQFIQEIKQLSNKQLHRPKLLKAKRPAKSRRPKNGKRK